MNKDIKQLWEDDFIDSRHVRFKKPKSLSAEAMDEDFTLKVQYPEVYKDLINKPLNRTVFKYVKGDDLMCDHFIIDLTNGEISEPLYPINYNQVLNVIDKILTSN